MGKSSRMMLMDHIARNSQIHLSPECTLVDTHCMAIELQPPLLGICLTLYIKILNIITY